MLVIIELMMMDQLMVAFLRKHRPLPKGVLCAVTVSLIEAIQLHCEKTG